MFVSVYNIYGVIIILSESFHATFDTWYFYLIMMLIVMTTNGERELVLSLPQELSLCVVVVGCVGVQVSVVGEGVQLSLLFFCLGFFGTTLSSQTQSKVHTWVCSRSVIIIIIVYTECSYISFRLGGSYFLIFLAIKVL